MVNANADIVFNNVNEEGETYNTTADLDNALALLRRFPNDTIVVTIKNKGRYSQCDSTCTVDCGHCKGRGPVQ